MERRHRHILETARTIRFQGHLPIRFWGHYVETIVHIINRVPSVVLNQKSPYEMLYGKIPLLSYLIVIVGLCYDTMLPKGDKFSHRALKIILLGFVVTQKGYKLYDPQERKIIVSRNVVFHERIFHFKSLVSTKESIPPSVDMFVLHDELTFDQEDRPEIVAVEVPVIV